VTGLGWVVLGEAPSSLSVALAKSLGVSLSEDSCCASDSAVDSRSTVWGCVEGVNTLQ
jgi:hypothetical protein